MLRADISALDVYQLRSDFHTHALHGGALRNYVASKLRVTRTERPTLHASSLSSVGSSSSAQKRKKQHFTLNNVEVCIPAYAKVLALSDNLFKMQLQMRRRGKS